jgi:uncharacterized protein (DUF488 family)
MFAGHIFTIGHSTHSAEYFLNLLAQAGITAVADVRSSPYSRFSPQFNREPLEKWLKERGLAYVFLGRELGARSEDPSCYENGRVKYDRLAHTDLFRVGIERLCSGVQFHRVALMCAEKEPLECHRSLLVSRQLVSHGQLVSHILADGSIEPHSATMSRLLILLGMPQKDLFHSQDDLVSVACGLQEERIAYSTELVRKRFKRTP